MDVAGHCVLQNVMCCWMSCVAGHWMLATRWLLCVAGTQGRWVLLEVVFAGHWFSMNGWDLQDCGCCWTVG